MTEGKLVIVKTKSGAQILARIAEIIPYNAFFTEGDAFSEARRKGMPVPEEVARRYEICRLDLLMKLPAGPDQHLNFPPAPGDQVCLYNPKQHEKEIFGKEKGDDKTVWFGSQLGYKDAPVPLDVENLPMHAAIFGVTGSGKSFNMGGLIESLSEIPLSGKRYSYPMIIIDANGDYSDYADHAIQENILGAVSDIKRVFFPSSYDDELRNNRVVPESLVPLAINLDDLETRDLAEMIVEFYKGGTGERSELQLAGIQKALEDLSNVGQSLHSLFAVPSSFESLRDRVRKLRAEGEIHSQTEPAIQRALSYFREGVEERCGLLSRRDDTPLGKPREFIERVTKKGEIVIFDFSADGATGVDLRIKQFVIGYLSSVLFNQFTKYKQKNDTRYLLFVIEEAQNFCPGRAYPIGSSLAKTKLSNIATQGRKFGLSLCLISQRPAFVDEIILSMCNTFFIHRISPGDVTFVRRVTGGLPDSLNSRLTNLSKGELILTGQMNLVPFPVLVKGSRRIVKTHSAGTTNVVETISKLRSR